PEQQQQVWSLYYQAAGVENQAGTGKGLGLGLYISHTIIERHGGTVGIESAPGAGATFWFTLPLRPPVSRRARASGERWREGATP
ncbi:MAG: HAMP domain-containing histidine kinase, partial [Ktedonobacterales bacterium]|nr:HAMP domain-containing histidine kinase [Ktedonobacterales bacterium]